MDKGYKFISDSESILNLPKFFSKRANRSKSLKTCLTRFFLIGGHKTETLVRPPPTQIFADTKKRKWRDCKKNWETRIPILNFTTLQVLKRAY